MTEEKREAVMAARERMMLERQDVVQRELAELTDQVAERERDGKRERERERESERSSTCASGRGDIERVRFAATDQSNMIPRS